jgi:hypothetical protein
MTLRPQEYRRRIRSARGHDGNNPGACLDCGDSHQWRSVHNRCRPCEVDSMKSRVPMWVERDILLATSKSG